MKAKNEASIWEQSESGGKFKKYKSKIAKVSLGHLPKNFHLFVFRRIWNIRKEINPDKEKYYHNINLPLVFLTNPVKF